MAIAALNAMSLMLTEEKASLETQRTILDQRRQMIALKTADMSSEYMIKMYQAQDEDEENHDINFDEDNFKIEYQAAVRKLDAQDKMLEMQRANLDTKIEAITTSLESADKRLEKNVEADMKGISK